MIFLDMDGVLADFNARVRGLGIPKNHMWFEPKETWTEEVHEAERLKKVAMHSPEFWLRIPLMPGARKLWDFANSIGTVGVLTAKPHKDSPALVGDEKLAWLRTKLGHISADRFVCCMKSEKSKYATKFSPIFGSVGDPNILVDDDHRNCDAWTKAGGVAIHHQSARQSIEQLAILKQVEAAVG